MDEKSWQAKWPLALRLLASVGITTILPELLGATQTWASTRSCTPKKLALRYLADLWSHGYTLPDTPAEAVTGDVTVDRDLESPIFPRIDP